MRRWIVRALLLALPLTALAACGDDDPDEGGGDASVAAPAEAAEPGAYIDGLCSAIVAYQEDLQAENTAFQEEMSGETPTPEATKDALVSFLGNAADRTQQLIDEVTALGTPDVGNGDEVRSTFETAFQQVIALFESARSDIEGLSTDDPAALAQGFTDAATKLQEAGAEISSSFDDLESPELDEAAADSESCTGVV